MCYHVSIPSREVIEKEFSFASFVDEWPVGRHHLSGFSFEATPVITAGNPDKIQLFHWGLIPGWVKDEDQASRMRKWCLNATSEHVFEKPSYRTPIAKSRCLIISDGFFEWREYKGKKYPYFIWLKEQKAFAFAGIYDSWTDKNTGEIINSYSIITTRANPLMEKIHNVKKRMPLILPRENQLKWIEGNLTKEGICQLMVPFDEKRMDSHTVSKLITSRKENSDVERVKDEFKYPELP